MIIISNAAFQSEMSNLFFPKPLLKKNLTFYAPEYGEFCSKIAITQKLVSGVRKLTR